jgi:hypothetical protein
VLETRALRFELARLAGARAHLVDGGDLKSKKRLALAPTALDAFELGHLFRLGHEKVDEVSELFPIRLELGEGVEVDEVGGRIGERNALVLGGDVDELGRELRELGRGAKAPVQVGARPSRGLHDPSQHDLVPGIEPRLRHPLTRPGGARHVEERLDLGFGGSWPHEVGRGAPPEHEAERADDDRFSGPGFAGQGVEAPLEPKVQLLDEDEVADAKLDEHGPLL